MDKNLILAIILSTIVIFVFHFFMVSQQKKYKPLTQNMTISEVSNVSIKKKEKLKQRPVIPSEKVYQFKTSEVTIDTSLYQAILTEAGARFKSFTLKKYKETIDPNSPPVELISTSGLGLPIEIYPLKEPGLGIIPFRANIKALHLSYGKEGKLIFKPLIKKPLIIHKELTFKDGSYLMDLKVKVENPLEYPQVERLLFRLVASPVAGLKGRLKRYAFTGPAYSHNGILEEVKLKKTGSFSEYTGDLDWAGFNSLYFLLAMVPPQGETWRATFRKLDSETYEVVLWSPNFTLSPKESKIFDLKLYFGPKSLKILKKAGYNLKAGVHFGIFDPLAKPLLYCMQFFYQYVHNYGLTIILLTIIIRLLFWPLNHLSYKNMKKMQELQPIIQRLKEKYSNDKARLNQELMQIYRTYKINPFMGCLPILIQIPVFFALYKVLLMAIELRHAPFFSWVNDLSAPDRLYVGFHIPYLGGIPVLTILMGLSMYLQQKLSPTSLDPTQARIMLFLPVFFTILFINFPSGLVLYWLTNNILSIIQQYMTNQMVLRSRK